MKKIILSFLNSFILVIFLIAPKIYAEQENPLPSYGPYQRVPIGYEPYGAPVSYEQVKKIVADIREEAKKRNVTDNTTIVIVGPQGGIVFAERAANASYADIDIALEKARSSAAHRNSNRWFRDELRDGALAQSLALPWAASMGAGGLPLIWQGHIIGAVAVSGTGDINDEAIAMAGTAALQ